MLSEFQHFSTIPGFCSCLQVPHKNATLYRRRNHEKGRWNGAPRNPLIRGKAACNRCQTPGVRVKKVGFYDSTFCQLFTRFSATPKIWKGEIHSKTHDKFIYKFINIMVAFFFSRTFSGDDPNLTCLLLVWDISSNYKSVAAFIPGTWQPITDKYVRRVGRPRREWVTEVRTKIYQCIGGHLEVSRLVRSSLIWRYTVCQRLSVHAPRVVWLWMNEWNGKW